MNALPHPADLLPHGPSMVLIDSIESWSEAAVVCMTMSHQRIDNPLRNRGRLSVWALIEYAAQAMAIHSSRAVGSPREGVLGSVRDFRCTVRRLDDIAAPLRIRASLLHSESRAATYSFVINADGREIASGRASVFLTRGER